jgi:hypothetical protein
MEYQISPGEACFTASEAKKLADQINSLGFKVKELRGAWMHYSHLRQKPQFTLEVSFLLSLAVWNIGWQ